MQNVAFNLNRLRQLMFIPLIAILYLNACKKSDPPLAPNEIQFETNKLGFFADESSIEVHLTLSRAAEQAGSLHLGIKENGVSYGKDYQTEPAASDGKLDLPVTPGAQELTFKIKKEASLLLEGEESVRFSLPKKTGTFAIGDNDSLEIQFAAIVSEGSKLKINGGPGGSAAENVVFIDLSANSQMATKRISWDLGFYSGEAFRVILNNTLPNAMAVATEKNSLSEVGRADTVGMLLSSTFSPADLKKVDDYTGDLSKTVIAAISSKETDNKVYILNRGEAEAHATGGRDWMKIRVIQNAGGYELQYADIAATDFHTVQIPKTPDHLFNYVSLDDGHQVDVMPEKTKWDIQWGVGSYFTPYGASAIYYPFSDLVFINQHNGVQAAEVLTTARTYEAFDDSDLSGIQFKSDRDVIGANWRATQGTVIGVYTDRFYVVKDPAGNYYKLKFINFTSQDGGTRGYPNIEYKLVKPA